MTCNDHKMDDLFSDPVVRTKERRDLEQDKDAEHTVGFTFPTDECAGPEFDEEEDENDEKPPLASLSPREEIKVTVQSYQRAADDFIFDVEVSVV